MNYADLLEALMILCFGVSWPISIRKSWASMMHTLHLHGWSKSSWTSPRIVS